MLFRALVGRECGYKLDPHILAVADEDGGLVIYDTEKVGPRAVQHDWLTHTNAVFDLEWTPAENSLLTASGDQTIVLWDVEEEEKLATFKGHTSSVKTVTYRQTDKFVFATGSRDGHIMIWDRRTKSKDGAIQPVNILHDAHKCNVQKTGRKKQETHQSVTAVVFQDDHTLLSAGSVDGSIKMWDLRRTHSTKKSELVPKYSFDYAGTSVRTHGFSSLLLDASRTRLFASCIDNVIYQFDCAALKPKPVSCYRGHVNSTFYVRTALSPDDRYLLSGSSDGNAYIWPVDLPFTSPLALMGHTGEVSGVGWCPGDFTKLVTLGDDNSMNFWRLTRRSGLLPKLPELIGWTERTHREIGVSVKPPPSAACALLKSPMKGTTLPQSPAKVSTTVRRNLIAMATTSSSVGVSPLTPLSISKWVSTAASKAGRSPRKLQVTPKKCATSTGASRVTQSSEEHSMKERVKRKLCDDIVPNTCRTVTADSGGPTSNKKLKCSDENVSNSNLPVNNNMNKDSQVMSTPLKSDSESCLAFHQGLPVAHDDSARKALFSLAEGSHDSAGLILSPSVSGARLPRFCPTNHQSPTQGLPNYVLNPEPRTPVGKLPPKPSHTPTWLTKWASEKSSPDRANLCPKVLSPGQRGLKHSSPVPPSGGGDKVVTPRSSGGGKRGEKGLRRSGGTPRMLGRRLQCATPPRLTTVGRQGSPQLDQGSPPVSILRYFSPKASVCRDVTQTRTDDKDKAGQKETIL
ncbi:hypothetical protein NP493_288g01025 [Ridgeia piscesae]|uniref:Denticleless protein homolog n=1 Tax=Ridgeia piscesae TaxID=27915 RepID=A0AAD9NWW5_RIDPI|nr:hypothetical protein NP493_288g01025 [Ridgeia piscesae]